MKVAMEFSTTLSEAEMRMPQFAYLFLVNEKGGRWHTKRLLIPTEGEWNVLDPVEWTGPSGIPFEAR